ncbi:MAG: restriction endonuclease subunit R [Leptolyngbya sp. BL-A-14]
MQTLQANRVTLATLESQFGLRATSDLTFFNEWRTAAETITPQEQQMLERVKANFDSLLKEPPLLEGAVKMVILSPLLDLAGFYQPPFRIRTEAEISIASPDEEAGVMIKGAIDVLVLLERLWVLVIESKMSDFSLTKALPQALSYTLSSPNRPCFGLITNGSDFVFIKLDQTEQPIYATSKVFSLLSPGNELVDVLRVLKHLGRLIRTDRL